MSSALGCGDHLEVQLAFHGLWKLIAYSKFEGRSQAFGPALPPLAEAPRYLSAEGMVRDPLGIIEQPG